MDDSDESYSSDYEVEKDGHVDLSGSRLDSWPSNDLSKSQVFVLKLHHNFIRELPTDITCLTKMVHLDVSSNSLTSLPSEITTLKSLRHLVAKNNSLGDSSLPKNFGSMTNLMLINLAGNSFRSIPSQVCELKNLKSLYLGGNSIKTISSAIAALSKLQILYLGGNELEHVPADLGKLKSLRSLSLCNNRLVSIPPTLACLCRLKSLSLHGNQLATLPQEIVGLDLQQLSLRDNPLVNNFVEHLNFDPPSLLELAGRAIKIERVSYGDESLPRDLVSYLDGAKHCVNPRCAGVYFTAKVAHINFVDFCGKYKLPLLQYLCSPQCCDPNSPAVKSNRSREEKIAKVLLG